jgi:6-phosphogluconate dehydrogenase (decarboxylating)
MLQAIGEGVDLLKHHGHKLDVANILRCWRHRPVIRSSLVDLRLPETPRVGVEHHARAH